MMCYQDLKSCHFFLILFFCYALTSCASSAVSRDATSNIEYGKQNAQNLVEGAAAGSIADAYQNTSQTTKGVIIGGAVGAITGALTSTIGFFPGTAAGIIMGGAYGRYIDSHATMGDRLENRGATVVILGDQILIVLPSARIFNYMTAEVKQDAYSTLELVTEFINRYKKMLVKVAAYTNDTGSARVDLALSQQQAQSVAKVLLESGVDARLLYARGYGGTHLVEKNTLNWDASDNYRIEITLEKLYT